MKTKFAALSFGVGFGFVMAWARLADQHVIRNMLLMREPDVFLLMGSAVFVAAIGARLLRARGARALITGEPVAWNSETPQTRHVVGSVLFGAGWSLAGTCPGPAAAMMGEGRVAGFIVAAGLVAGVVLQGVVARLRTSDSPAPVEISGAAGL